MKIAIKLSGLALILVLGATAVASQRAPRCTAHDACTSAAPSAIGDPDPTDCPFCGGNPTVHVQKMFLLERVSTALSATLLR